LKFFAWIFALYLLTLNAIPCCELDNCGDGQTEQSSHQDEKKSCNNCSPFFSCEGCAAATIIYDPISFIALSTINLPAYNIYTEGSLPGTDRDFWQPPKL
jgi:hypothetical protein